ncbi:sigma-54 dependent transcriptional regulator [Pseudomonas sp. No.21]|jgi:DNA-binding NtrC family response regulator|uniref:sigma-54-dependent transcriptional regulator n=1 Tax=Pseudomonas TaxID=286 RepID=UPI000DA96E90|nr:MULTISPECIES: sigma-54 dependent transcriptional regulator [Pseudomonas]MDW3716236.1 sigma-54 dependent transcriptional regulator [Pseudomonas sp. 2023EL-01195]PZE10337.1 sigma-54-dependent Fis family transcriptional regulator [Pseudomonas sp. 57B-090624]GJN48822.1 sigma-54-dependent Fis family transcriptional regulator [Pseudomonas tohonis]
MLDTITPTARRVLMIDPCEECRQLLPRLQASGWTVESRESQQAQAGGYDVGLLCLRHEHLDNPERIKTLISSSGTEWIGLLGRDIAPQERVEDFAGEWFFDTVEVPVDSARLQGLLGRAFGIARLRGLGSRQGADHELLGQSRPLRDLRKQLAKFGPLDRPVLILGESGTGKELVARTLHRYSRRVGGPFVAFNCGVLDEAGCNAALFGPAGRLQAANGGSLFLDAVSELPLEVQRTLMHCLRTRKLPQPQGPARALDVRLLVASDRDIELMAEQGRFLPELYQLLAPHQVRLTPLRRRQGDIALLANYFADLYSLESGHKPRQFSEEALTALVRHHWPGNVRELASRVRRGYALAEGEQIEAADLGLHSVPMDSVLIGTLDDYKRRAEYQALCDALARYGNNLSLAARVLGISRPTFYRLLHKHQLL